MFKPIGAIILLAACSHPTTDARDTASADSDATEAPWPEWAWQHWVWEGESTQGSAIALVDDYLAHDIPVSAIILDSPWAVGYNTFVFDPERFPDPQAMIDHFHDLGVRVMLWVVPAMNTDVPEGQPARTLATTCSTTRTTRQGARSAGGKAMAASSTTGTPTRWTGGTAW